MRQFFEQNETIILFGHGLMFFTLGFAVWLQRRRASRLLLTHALIWLAAFAFIEAFAVWGRAFVPIQEGYLRPHLADALVVTRGVLQTAAFLFLVQFGLRLLAVSPRTRYAASVLSVVVWAAALSGSAVIAQSRGWGIHEWEWSAVAVSRLALLLPGAVLSAVGLWRQRGELAAAGMVAIKPYAAVAAGVLLVYALLGGLVLDPAPWLLGVDEAGWFRNTGVPLAVVRGLAGLVLCVVSVKLLDIFEVEAKQRLDALERARAVSDERARFRRDLHDGTIQTIYAAALHLEATAQRCPTDELRADVRSVVRDLNAAIDDIRRYITDLSETPDTPAGVATRLRKLAAELAVEAHTPIRVKVEGEDVAGPIPEGAGRHLKQITREGISNAARHAGPCAVDITLSFGEDELVLVIKDDGAGIDPAVISEHESQGMRNMRERARRLGGRLDVDSGPSGTRLVVSVPLDIEVPAPAPVPATHRQASEVITS